MRLAGAGVQAVRGGVGQPFLAKLAASAAISPFGAGFALSSDSKSESSTYLVVFFFFLSDRNSQKYSVGQFPFIFWETKGRVLGC